MRRYINLPIEKLVSDVTVDPVHVRELADSIKVSGPISPVLVREENLALIDGFHRVAAMKELGFHEVESIVTPCDEETFWDLRIISASLHKAVTFARVIDWIDEVFRLSLWKDQHKSAYSLFATVNKRGGTKEEADWVTAKAQKWGLAPATVQNWLYAKQSLSPDLLEEAKYSARNDESLSLQHYQSVARTIPGRRDLQRRVIEKARTEGLTSRAVEEVAKAVRQAEDEEEVESILRQPVSRTENQMVREAKVEKILSHPREITPLEKYQEAKHEDVLFKLDLLGILNSSRAMTPEKISALTPDQKEDVYRTCEEVIAEMQRIMDMTKPAIQAEYQLKEG